MTFKRYTLSALLGLSLLVPGIRTAPLLEAQMGAAPAAPPQSTTVGVLPREAAEKLVPPAVFFSHQVASTQARNSAVVRLPGGALIVATLVDTSGYSSNVQEKYQAYLITETAIAIDGHTLPAGSYGFGFVANDTFLVMDISGATLLTAHSTKDAEMRRPVPLQMAAVPSGGYRLYAGRNYVTLEPASK